MESSSLLFRLIHSAFRYFKSYRIYRLHPNLLPSVYGTRAFFNDTDYFLLVFKNTFSHALNAYIFHRNFIVHIELHRNMP